MINDKIRIVPLLALLATACGSPLAFAQGVPACNIGPQQKTSGEWINDSGGPPADCASGPIPMWATIASVRIDKGNYVFVPDPPCGSEPRKELGDLVQNISSSVLGDKLAKIAGDLSNLIGTPAEAWIAEQGGDLGKIVVPPGKRVAACGLAVAVVPVEADVLGYRLESWHEDAGAGGCPTDGNDCSSGYSKFLPPQIFKSSGMQTVSAEYRNWNSDWPGVGIMIIFYRSAHRPLSPM